MTIAIGNKEPNTGRLQKEDGTVVNIADLAARDPHTFHESVLDASVPNGSMYENTDDRDMFTFDVAGTSTAQVYQFRGIGPRGNDNLIKCYRQSDSVDGTGTSVRGETWQAPIKGLKFFYVKLMSIAGGTGIVGGEGSAKS